MDISIGKLYKNIDEMMNLMNDSIVKNRYYNECIPMTTANIHFERLNTLNKQPYECCCYHFTGISININSHFNDEDKCGICLKTWDLRNNEIIKLSCNHYFHKKCILKWFSNDCSNSCPICRCPHDSCLTPERELASNMLNNEVNKQENRVISSSSNNGEAGIIAVVTHILPFSVNSIQKINIDALYAKDFTVTSVISEKLYSTLKKLYGLRAELEEPVFYITNDNDIYMSDKYITLPISFPYIYYKNSYTTNDKWIPTCGKTPVIYVKFKIINFIQNDLLLVSKYDLSKNLIHSVTTESDPKKDMLGNIIENKSILKYNFSLMKSCNYVDESFLIPYAYVKKTNVDIEILNNSKHRKNKKSSFSIINIMPAS